MELLLLPRASVGGGAGRPCKGGSQPLNSPSGGQRGEPRNKLTQPASLRKPLLGQQQPWDSGSSPPQSILTQTASILHTLLYLSLPECSCVSLVHEEILCKLQNTLSILVVTINNSSPSLI